MDNDDPFFHAKIFYLDEFNLHILQFECTMMKEKSFFVHKSGSNRSTTRKKRMKKNEKDKFEPFFHLADISPTSGVTTAA